MAAKAGSLLTPVTGAAVQSRNDRSVTAEATAARRACQGRGDAAGQQHQPPASWAA